MTRAQRRGKTAWIKDLKRRGHRYRNGRAWWRVGVWRLTIPVRKEPAP